MFNWFKKFFNSKQSRLANYKDIIFEQAQKMVRFSVYGNDFFGYNSKLINPESRPVMTLEPRPELYQIIMEKDGYTATTAFEKRVLDNENDIEEIWKEILKPQLIKCKKYIDKQMKQAFIDIEYKKFIELNPNLTTNK